MATNIKKEEMYKQGKAVISDKQRKSIKKDISNLYDAYPDIKKRIGSEAEIFKRIAKSDLKPSYIKKTINHFIMSSAEKGTKYTKDGKTYYKYGYDKRGDSIKGQLKKSREIGLKLGLIKDPKKNPSPPQMDKNKRKNESKSKGSPNQRNKKKS
tara:strand:+ start:95 stop:556 length:462 start_codon:yes stop_codon:yes gene_type:complete